MYAITHTHFPYTLYTHIYVSTVQDQWNRTWPKTSGENGVIFEPPVKKAPKQDDGAKTHGVEAIFAIKGKYDLVNAQEWKGEPARERREPVFLRRPPPRRNDGRYVCMRFRGQDLGNCGLENMHDCLYVCMHAFVSIYIRLT